MNLSPEVQTALNLIIGGAFYDQVKIASALSFNIAKETLAKYLPLKKDEIDTIEAEILSLDSKVYSSAEELQKYINENETIQIILKNLEEREPKKVKEIVNSFKKNNTTSFDLTLGDNVKIADSFNENENCEIKIR